MTDLGSSLGFVRQWLRSPRQTAAVVPSSRRLAQAMVSALPETVSKVVELGPGTGPVTRALVTRFPDPGSVVAVEINPAFAASLRRHFPSVLVSEGDARDLPSRLREVAPAGWSPDAVVSSLGFLAMPSGVVREILRSAFSSMGQDGVLVQFTYGAKVPVSGEILADLGLESSRAGLVLRNAPPATVHVIRRTP